MIVADPEAQLKKAEKTFFFVKLSTSENRCIFVILSGRSCRVLKKGEVDLFLCISMA